MRRAALILTFVVLLVGTAVAETKREWQTGTWRDTNRTSETVGAVQNGSANGGSFHSTSTPVRRVYQLYVIETEGYIYEAEQRLRWRWSDSVPLTVNESVMFAIEKDKVFVIGEDKKEYQLSLVKKTKKVR